MEGFNKPTGLAIGLFVLAVLVLPALILPGQSISWFLEQMAILSHSAASLSLSGRVWFIVQALVVITITGLFFFFSHSTLRSTYRGWLLAALVTLPALGLRFIDPNSDQSGTFVQILIGLLGGGLILFIRRKSLDFTWQPVLKALAVVPFAIWPFLLWGALGSWMDVLLSLLAGLSFGLLAASLAAPSTGNFLLDGLGLGTLLLILGSAYGYDGSQLLLIAALPSFGFVFATLIPSVPAMVTAIGLLAAVPLIFIDPTELAIVLGDLSPWAAGAAFLMALNGLVLGFVLWLFSKWRSRPAITAFPFVLSAFAWGVALLLYLGLGSPGFYGDRLFAILKDQADVSAASGVKDRLQRLTYVYDTLTRHASQTQAGITNTFDRFGIPYRSYYLVNALEVQGGSLLRLYLITQPEVDRVLASPRLRPLPQPVEPSSGGVAGILENPGWNIKMIGADKVWNEFGITGQGIVVGQSDSGADGTHPALKAAYRGAQTGDDYNWFDPWEHTSSPVDLGGHGTHTLGTILGQGGIGVAPGAQWMACANLNRNLGNPALYLDCMQFMLAPFPKDGEPFTDGNPSRAAHVLNNSWGCPPLEGCDPDALRPAAEALRAAGIFVVVSTGNDGPNCETVDSPLALYDSVFSVGALDRFGNLAGFSSRGPVTVDGSGRVKPDITAPGVDVFSSIPGGTYTENSGTSMAGPHLVGVVALLWSANPALVGDIDRTEQILIETAQPYTGSISDGCFSGSIPNTGYGFGIVDAYSAVKEALGK